MVTDISGARLCALPCRQRPTFGLARELPPAIATHIGNGIGDAAARAAARCAGALRSDRLLSAHVASPLEKNSGVRISCVTARESLGIRRIARHGRMLRGHGVDGYRATVLIFPVLFQFIPFQFIRGA